MKLLYFNVLLSLFFINCMAKASEELANEMKLKREQKREYLFKEGKSITVSGDNALIKSIKKVEEGVELSDQGNSLIVGINFKLKDPVIEGLNKQRKSALQNTWDVPEDIAELIVRLATPLPEFVSWVINASYPIGKNYNVNSQNPSEIIIEGEYLLDTIALKKPDTGVGYYHLYENKQKFQEKLGYFNNVKKHLEMLNTLAGVECKAKHYTFVKVASIEIKNGEKARSLAIAREFRYEDN